MEVTRLTTILRLSHALARSMPPRWAEWSRIAYRDSEAMPKRWAQLSSELLIFLAPAKTWSGWPFSPRRCFSTFGRVPAPAIVGLCTEERLTVSEAQEQRRPIGNKGFRRAGTWELSDAACRAGGPERSGTGTNFPMCSGRAGLRPVVWRPRFPT